MLRSGTRFALIPLIGGLLAPVACDDSGFCPEDALGPSIIITVRDARNGKPAAAGCQGTVTGRNYTDSLQVCCVLGDGTPIALAAYASAGTFVVEVHKQGYRSWRRTNVRVLQGECGLNTVRLDAYLEPQ